MQSSAQETADLFALADRDLHDCLSPGLSSDWRLNIAYNAALQLATAALAASGYRAERKSHHYRVIQSLALTICTSACVVDELDGFRKKRNVGGYEHAGSTSDQEAQEMISVARHLREQVRDWLRREHPDLALDLQA
jgi:hypothetical protein